MQEQREDPQGYHKKEEIDTSFLTFTSDFEAVC